MDIQQSSEDEEEFEVFFDGSGDNCKTATDVCSLLQTAASHSNEILSDEGSISDPVSVSSFHGTPFEWNISGAHALKNVKLLCDANRSSSSRNSSGKSKTSAAITVSSFHAHPFEWNRSGVQLYFEDEELSTYGSDSFEDDVYIPYLDEVTDKASIPEEELSADTVFAPSFRKRENKTGAKMTCSLSDILDQTSFTEKKESTEPVYGANRLFITGEEVGNPDDLRKNEQYRTASYHRRYFSKCVDHLKSTCCSGLAELEAQELLSDSVYETFLYGSRYKFERHTWILAWEPWRLTELTTHTVQAVICAALNSKRKLQWVVGIGSHNEVVGCIISRKQRDKMRQAFDFCTSSGFFPRLPVRLARIRFHVVRGYPYDKDKERYLVEIGIRERVTNLYQIAPNHIFYVDGSEVKDLQEVDKARLALAKHFEQQQCFANAKDGRRRLVSLMYLGSLRLARSFLWREFFMFSLSGVLLGLSLRRFVIRSS